jgi:putative tryptophan/tyrosine transport system substrate-binding protein
MRRRNFIAGIAGAAVTWASNLCLVRAQGRVANVGFISGLDEAAAADFIRALREGLAALGYVEPQSLNLGLGFADYHLDRIPALLEELQRQHVKLIVTHAAATSAVVKHQRTIPVVYEFSADPVSLGIAKDLAHPLYNATGITLMMAEMNGKRLELLHEIAPQMRRVAVLAHPLHPGMQFERADFEAKAKQLGVETAFFPIPDRAELDRAVAAIDAQPPHALVAFSDAFVVQNRNYIVNFAMSRRFPVISGWAVMADAGALCTYGPRLIESYRRTAYFIDRILKGTPASELPIEQPTVLELVINLNSARTLGISIPSAVLVRADRVIE